MRIGSLPLLSARFRVIERSVFVDINRAQVAFSNSSRVALIFHNPGAAQVNVSTLPTVTTSSGVIVQSATLPWTLIFKDVASLATLDWYAISTIGGTNLTVFEVIELPEPESEEWGEPTIDGPAEACTE